ncbi:hypothetical protein Ga0074115_11947 [endosymbiont of Ridgeia piscesae]|jgi:hypothetical protein|uniref:Uncharacterized protein n=1 Tax=endosymbiont of Ridgeia piscesae TaxID=54398 RepID=A0A0T5YZB3_9GAMM|nr:hypothetical protein Ga0074115_11947 [endosymbiont of Ridgeia piscesae]KRT58166.1 hypothetical protein Ga0076813_12963 [endosymbiont of Ridgeia piscesae]
MNLGEQSCEAKFSDARRKSQVIAGLLPRFPAQQRAIWIAMLPFMIHSEAP